MVITTQEMVSEMQGTGAIFGRNKEVSVIFEGEQAYTDGKEIVLPSMVQDATLTPAIQKVMRGYLDHEAGHVRHTDFEVLEAEAKKSSGGLKAIWNSLEDIWLEAKVIREYPGAEKNLKQLVEHVRAKELEGIDKDSKAKKTLLGVNKESICMGICSVGRLSYGGELNKKEAEEYISKKMYGWSKAWTDAVHKCQNTEDVWALAREVAKKIKDDPELESNPEDFDFQPGGKSDGSGEPSEETGGKEPSGNFSPEDVGEGPDSNTGKNKTGVKVVDDNNKIAEDIFGGSGITPPKGKGKNKQYRVLTTRFDQVLHKDNTSDLGVHKLMKTTPPTEYDKIKAEVGPHVMVMKSKLRRAITALEQRDWDYGRSNGSLDNKRLVSATLGLENVYKKRIEREELDTAVLMLVDLSGSMCGEKMETAGKSAIAFAECFEGTSINYQVAGFSNRWDSSRGNQEFNKVYSEAQKRNSTYHRVEPLQVYQFKRFNDKLFSSKGAMAALTNASGGNNTDRCALMWAYEELKKQPQKRKILLVFSDGSPACITIGEPDLYGTLKDGVDWIEKKGIETIGIGIYHDVKDIYKNNASVYNLDDLSGTMFNKLTNILLNQRRVK